LFFRAGSNLKLRYKILMKQYVTAALLIFRGQLTSSSKPQGLIR
jgi:hypothetical protein